MSFPPKKMHEQKLKHLAKQMGALISGGLTIFGVSPSAQKLIQFADNDMAGQLSLIAGLTIGSLTALSLSPPVNVLNEVYREGLDTEVDAYRRMPHRMALVKSSAWGTIEKFMHQFTSLTRSANQSLDMHKQHSAFLKSNFQGDNVVNIVHAIALLGRDPTPFAKKLRASTQGYDNELVKAVFSNSANLIEILKPNMGNLLQFGHAVRQSMGDDAAYFLKNCKDYNEGITEWHALFDAVQKDYMVAAQKVAYHHQAAHLIASTITHSANKTLTVDVATRLRGELLKFQGALPLQGATSITVENQTAQYAVRVANRLGVLLQDKAGQPGNLNSLCDWPELTVANRSGDPLQRKRAITGNLTVDSVQEMRQSLMPWTRGVGGFEAETLFAETLFKKLKELAKNSLEKSILKTPDSVDWSNNGEQIQQQLKALGVPQGDIKQFSPDASADHLVRKLQLRMAQSVVLNEHTYQAYSDTHRDASKVTLNDYTPVPPQEGPASAPPGLDWFAPPAHVEELPDLPTLAERTRLRR